MRKTSRPASLQHHYVRAREIVGEALCLFSAASPTRRVYRAVLEVSALNFLLKAEEEQDALVERFRSLLKSLTFPLQILLRHQRLDLRPYLAQIQAQVPLPSKEAPGTGRLARPAPTWSELATGLETLLSQMESQRTLIERRCYLVIPAPDPPTSAHRLLRRTRRQEQREEMLARTLQELDIRVEMVQHQLAALGLRSRRIGGGELARLYQSCLIPEHSRQHPLRKEHLTAVGHFPRLKSRAADKARVLSQESLVQPSSDEDLPLLPVHLAEQEQAARKPFDDASAHRWRQPHRAPGKKARARLVARVLPLPDVLRLADLLAPASLEEYRDALCIDGEWVHGIAITAFPREVSTGGWLAPLLLHDGILDLVLHIHPQDQSAMMRQLRRRRASYASTRVFHRQQGRLDDPEIAAAHNDVARLMSQLASGGERIFDLTFLLLVRAPDRSRLDERTERLMALLHTVFLDPVAHPTTFEHAQALRTALPEGRDELRRTITLDSTSVATTFPFLSNSLLMPGGCLLGITGTGEPVLLDPWDTTALENPHTFIGGVTGAGKSSLGKLWLARSLLSNGVGGERHWVIDPDGEYAPVAAALSGVVIRIAPGSAHHLNPFDVLPPGCDLDTYLEEVRHADRLAEKIQDLHALLDLMLADHGTLLGMREKALLDRALYEVYRRVGISADPRTHYHQPPLLRDLAEVLRSGVCGPDETGLGFRLSRYTQGSLAGLLDSQTNVPLDSHLVVWDVREMRGDLRPLGIWLIADCLWTQAVYRHMRRCLFIDEAASLVEHPEGGRFLANLSRRARKRSLRLVTMTQSPERFVCDEWGSVIASNAAIKILKLQDRTSVRAVASRFGLTRGEEQQLLALSVREALLLAGDRRVLLSIQASEPEERLITTNPPELAHREPRRKEGPDGEIPSAQETPVPQAPRTGQDHQTPGREDPQTPTDPAIFPRMCALEAQATSPAENGGQEACCSTLEE